MNHTPYIPYIDYNTLFRLIHELIQFHTIANNPRHSRGPLCQWDIQLIQQFITVNNMPIVVRSEVDVDILLSLLHSHTRTMHNALEVQTMRPVIVCICPNIIELTQDFSTLFEWLGSIAPAPPRPCPGTSCKDVC
jgi:hypothetical protein